MAASRRQPPHTSKFIIIIIIIIITFTAFGVALNTGAKEYSSMYEDDRVRKLPGQQADSKSSTVSQFSGHITVDEGHGRALFYWFFEAQSHPATKPLLLWLNGGPGCSSIGYGAAVELGPLTVGKNGDALHFNQHSWNKEANLLFLESPIGVGFSYSNTSTDFSDINDSFAAEDAYIFLVKWFERFPHFKTHHFYISGESYAGHYVPQLAELVHDRNKMTTSEYPNINLKGFIVGNPETDDYFDSRGISDYAWSHAVISDDEYDDVRQSCNFKLENWSRKCNKAMGVVFDRYEEIDIYNIYAPSCLTNKTSSSHAVEDYHLERAKTEDGMLRRLKLKIPGGGYDPCYSHYVEAYFNRIDVQRALHVKPPAAAVQWKVCSDSVFRRYNYTVFSILPIYKKLIKAGLRIWIYSGDADGRVPLIGSRYCVEALKLPLTTPWTAWFHNHQVAGRMAEYEGLTLVSVRGAGHLVPLNKPEEALALIHSYLSSQSLPTHRF